MIVDIIPALKDNYIYSIRLSSNNVCIVDPSEEGVVIKYCEAQKLTVEYILLTHHHWDHTNGVEALKNKYNCKVIGPNEPLKPISNLDTVVADNSEFKLNDLIVKAIHVPGHTLGQVCYYFKDQDVLFVGDTLFGSGCGRVFEGTYQQMHLSLQKLSQLPQNTKVYCGHEYTNNNLNFLEAIIRKQKLNKITLHQLHEYKKSILKKIDSEGSSIPLTLKDELIYNPFLNAASLEEFTIIRDLRNNF